LIEGRAAIDKPQELLHIEPSFEVVVERAMGDQPRTFEVCAGGHSSDAASVRGLGAIVAWIFVMGW
jgi:hypothetical protein